MDHNKDFVQSIVDRMKTVLGFSKDKELADYLGGSRSTTAVWKSRGTIPINECISIAVKNGVSLDWLVLGRGPGPSFDLIAQASERAESDQANFVDVPVFDMSTFHDEAKSTGIWKLPRAWIDQEWLSAVDTILMRTYGVGDTMNETLVDGQLVILDRRPSEVDGVFLVRIGGQLRVRRMQRMIDRSVRLSVDNKVYAVETLPAEEVGKLEIIGRCHAAVAPVR